MCNVCDDKMMARRRFLGLAGMGLVAGSMSLMGGSAAWAAGGPKTTLTADQALAKLMEGNAKFVAGPQLCEADLLNAREKVSHGQAPWATIVGCADSRVPPELVFGGLNVGEIFIARNAGNMVDTATMGTIEYGSGVLGVPLIVVLGHQSCGAVAAACDAVTKKAHYPGSIEPMVKQIIPSVKAVLKQPGDLVDNAVRENAKRTAKKIATKSPIISGLVKEGKVKVVAARYDLEKGKVEFLG